MPLEEVEKLKALRVRLVKANTELVRNLTVRLPPTATVNDLLDKARPPPPYLPSSSAAILCHMHGIALVLHSYTPSPLWIVITDI